MSNVSSPPSPSRNHAHRRDDPVGHDIRAVVAPCRWAAQAGVPVHAVAARGTNAPLYLTRYAAQVSVERRSVALDLDPGPSTPAAGAATAPLADALDVLKRAYLKKRGQADALWRKKQGTSMS